MGVKVFDYDGTERDWQWLRSEYGNVQVVAAPAGAEAFRLAELHVTHGPAAIVATVQESDGRPKEGQPVANTWPGIQPDSAHQIYDLRGDPSLKTVYASIACVQRTDGNGLTGFGIGSGSVISLDPTGQGTAGHDAGPHSVWVLSPSVPSDVVTGLGWRGDSDHWGPLRPVFRLAEMVGGDPGDPGGPGGDPGPVDGATVRGLAQTALAKIAEAQAAVNKLVALIG